MEVALTQQFAVILSVTSLLMFLTYLPNNKHIPGVKLWALAFLCFSIAHLILLQAQTLAPFWSIFTANILLVSTLTLITIGTRLFYGLNNHNKIISGYLLSSLIAVSYYFTFYAPDTIMRRVLLSLIALSCFIIIIFSLLSARPTYSKAKNLLLILCIGTSAIIFLRIYLLLHFNNQEPLLVQQLVELYILSAGVSFAIAFSMLCQERYTDYRRAIDIKNTNDIALKTLYMQSIESEFNKPLKSLIEATDSPSIKEERDITEHAYLLNTLAQAIFSHTPPDLINKDNQPRVSYTQLEDWIVSIASSLRALAIDKQIRLSLNFPDPIAPCYLLEKYKLQLLLINLFTQIISIKGVGAITLTINVSPSISSREAANIRFDFSEPRINHHSDRMTKESLSENFGCQFSEQIIRTLGSQLEYYRDGEDINHIVFEIKASEGLHSDVRYQIPRYKAVSISHLDILLISNNQHTQQDVTDSLNHYQHYLDIALNTDQSIQRLNSTKYDVIILDINSTDFYAFDIPDLIKKHCVLNSEIPIIALSNNVSAPAKFELAAEGLTTLVARPLQEGSLQRAINYVVKEKSTASQSFIQDSEQSDSLDTAEPVVIVDEPADAPTDAPHVLDPAVIIDEPDDAPPELKPENSQTTVSINDAIDTPEVPPFTSRKKERVQEELAKDTEADIKQLFNPNALTLLERNAGESTLKEIIKSTNKEIYQLLAQFKQYLASREHSNIEKTVYNLALSSDKLGYTALAEKLLTIPLREIKGGGETEFLQCEKLLLQSQQQLAMHMKTLQ